MKIGRIPDGMLALALVPVTLLLSSCNLRMKVASQVPLEDMPDLPSVPAPQASAAQVPPGYRVEIVVTDLQYPTSVEFDDRGNLYIAEAGYAYGDPVAPPRVLRVTPAGDIAVVASGLNGPVNDLLWHDGQLYISHRGKISAVAGGQGPVRDLVTDLPSLGDHHNNQMAVGPDNRIYFGQGTASNSGVVGLDNFAMGWLQLHPRFHDRPAQAIDVEGRAFTSINPLMLTTGEGPMAKTSGFAPFDATVGEVEGVVKANGTILRMNPDGSGLEVYAWGLRNPYGVAWGTDRRLYVAENGFDERGSRPIANAPDNIWIVEQGGWYGWPDYASGIPVTDPRFKPDYAEEPAFLMANHPPVGTPLLTIPEHSGITKLAVSSSASFGFPGNLFLAEFGDMTPLTGDIPRPNGYQVSRIDPRTGTRETFFRVSEAAEGPDGFEYVATSGPKRPVGVRFSPDGEALYVADFGAFAMITAAAPVPIPFPATGVVWRIVREGARVSGPPANLSAAPGASR